MNGPNFNPKSLRVGRSLLQRMATQATREAPLECCGLLGGKRQNQTVWIGGVFPLRNHLGRPDRFEGHPEDHFRALRQMRDRGWDWVGTYHSHPSSPPLPSHTDRERAQGAGMVDLILGATKPPGEDPTVLAIFLENWWLAWWCLDPLGARCLPCEVDPNS